jgi:PDZ domain-containing protein
MRPLRGVFLPLSLAILLTAAMVVPLPAFLGLPGETAGLGERVTVGDGGELSGDFLLTTVDLRRATVVGLVRSLFDDSDALVGEANVIPPGVDDELYFERQQALFASSADLAAAIGLRAAGYEVDPEDFSGDGALIVAVLTGSAADGALLAGDVVVGIDGRPIATAEDLRDAIRAGAPGRPRQISYLRGDERRQVEVTPRPLPPAEGPVLGVQIETRNPEITLPVPVEVESGEVGGPSAGLLIALTVYDKAVDDDLTAGRLIAGTGTLSRDGTVGPIGGIAQKVIAANRAGADVFLAPASQAEVAAAAIPEGSDLEVVAAASFADAVDGFERTGARTAALSHTARG